MSRFLNRNFELLEPYDAKVSCTVLRGESSRKGADLLDKEYYDKLKAVHDLVKDAKKVRDAILIVGEIGDIYVNSYQKMLSDPNFRYEELVAIANGYTILLQESSDMILELKDVVNANGLSMTDHERMDIINYVYDRLKNHRNLVSYYTRKNISISYLRAKKAGETDRVLALYGDANERYW
jgi:hypothetical protein